MITKKERPIAVEGDASEQYAGYLSSTRKSIGSKEWVSEGPL
jgi:hypothetical protein